MSLRILDLEPVWNECKHPRHHLRGLPRTCVHCDKVFWCSNRCDKANPPVHEPNCASKRGSSVKANAESPPHSSGNSDHGAATQATTDEAVKGERDGGDENDEKDEELTDSALQSPTLMSSPCSSEEEGSTDSASSLPSLAFSTDDEDEGGSIDNGILILPPHLPPTMLESKTEGRQTVELSFLPPHLPTPMTMMRMRRMSMMKYLMVTGLAVLCWNSFRRSF